MCVPNMNTKNNSLKLLTRLWKWIHVKKQNIAINLVLIIVNVYFFGYINVALELHSWLLESGQCVRKDEFAYIMGHILWKYKFQ